MKLKFSDLWRWNGEISRAPFLIWALLLFAVKYNLDRLVLRIIFGRNWSLFNYFHGPIPWLSLSPAEAPKEYAVLLTAALPFLWAGVALCVKRLRSARLSLWLAVLFVVPVLKWFLFVALGLAPVRDERGPKRSTDDGQRGSVPRWFPKSTFGSAALAVGLSAWLALVGAVFGTEVLRDYGWGLFAGVPFCMGFFAALIHGARQRRSMRESLLVALVGVALAGVMLLLVAVEGLICVLMAAPLAVALAAIGALAGHAVQTNRWRDVPRQLYCIPLLALPLMLGSEHLSLGPPSLLQVTTRVEVNAAPAKVWEHVVAFSELPAPTELPFKLGIAYPIRAEIQGRGAGAVRHCVFSTGPFVEPIVVWDEPRLLRFSVTQNPTPMQEWTPYPAVHPPHLDGFLVSRQGQFLLTPLPGGRTRLEGTTWYHHRMWPAGYWQLWSDQIIHTIHRRVLNHVKQLAEENEIRTGL